MPKKKPAKGKDWRSLPRKPDEMKRTTRLNLKLKASECESLRANAGAANMSVVDYVVVMCCGKRWSAK